jgi:hypothetical protein
MIISTDKKFHRFTIALDDFEEALAYIEQAKLHRRGSLEHQALVSMAVICYSRPFSPNEKRADAKAQSRLSEEDLGTFSSSEKQLHDLCTTSRTKAVAHSEYDYNPTEINDSSQIWSRHFCIYDAEINLAELESLIRGRIDACHAARAPYVTYRRAAVDADEEEKWLATLASLTQQ